MKIRIGVDPGTKTGIAAANVDSTKKIFLCETDTIIGAMKTVEDLLFQECTEIEIWFEDARKRKWIPKTAGRERLQGAGSVKRDCAIWQQFCEHHKIPFSSIAPKNISTKMSKDTFRKLTGWKGRTSTHARDACLIIFGS